jgi:hypothetical protein
MASGTGKSIWRSWAVGCGGGRSIWRRELMVECRKHAAAEWLQSVPFLGPIRAALLIGRVQTPHRFRSKRQFWSYCGLALETRDSSEYRVVNGQVKRKRKSALIRGLNWNHNHEMKNLFKSTATAASVREGVWREFYVQLLAKGMRPEMARLTPGAQDRRHYAEDLEERGTV